MDDRTKLGFVGVRATREVHVQVARECRSMSPEAMLGCPADYFTWPEGFGYTTQKAVDNLDRVVRGICENRKCATSDIEFEEIQPNWVQRVGIAISDWVAKAVDSLHERM